MISLKKPDMQRNFSRNAKYLSYRRSDWKIEEAPQIGFSQRNYIIIKSWIQYKKLYRPISKKSLR
jgi:hypothetical protein